MAESKRRKRQTMVKHNKPHQKPGSEKADPAALITPVMLLLLKKIVLVYDNIIKYIIILILKNVVYS